MRINTATTLAASISTLVGLSGIATGQSLPCMFENILSTTALESEAFDLVKDGDLIYIAAGDAGLLIVDVSDPSAASIVGQYDTAGTSKGVSVNGIYAYIADDGPGLRVIDVSDPASPAQVGSVNTPGIAVSVKVRDGLAYVADWSKGLSIVDVSDPTSPSVIGNYDTSGQTSDVALMGSNALLADRAGGLVIVDVHEPDSPVVVGSLPDLFLGAVAVSGDQVVAVTTSTIPDGENWLYNLDLSDASAPMIADSFRLSENHTPLYNTDRLTLNGDRVLVNQRSRGLRVFDINNSDALAEVYTHNTAGTQRASVYDAGTGIAFALDSVEGLMAIQINGTEEPLAHVESFDSLFRMQHVIADDTYMVTVTNEGYMLHDNSDPRNPVGIGFYADTIVGIARHRSVWDSHLLQFLSGGYYAQDLHAPAEGDFGVLVPVHLGSTSLKQEGPLVYWASSIGFGIVDISDLMNPVVLNETLSEDERWPRGIAVSGDRIYVAIANEGVRAYDSSDPSSLVHLGTIPLEIEDDNSGEMQAIGDFVFLPGSNDYGMRVIDFSDPESPMIDTQLSLDETVPHLYETNGQIYAHLPSLNSFDDAFNVYTMGQDGRPEYVGHLGTLSQVQNITNGAYYGKLQHEFGEVIDLRPCQEACAADLDGNGSLDFFDVSAFLTAFGANEPTGDFDGSGTWDFFDVSGFLTAFNAGCP